MATLIISEPAIRLIRLTFDRFFRKLLSSRPPDAYAIRQINSIVNISDSRIMIWGVIGSL